MRFYYQPQVVSTVFIQIAHSLILDFFYKDFLHSLFENECSPGFGSIRLKMHAQENEV